MDLALLSVSNSPLASVLLSDVNLRPMVYSTLSSLPMCSRQRISVPCSSSFNFDKSMSFSIPRYGILYGLCLKVCFTGSYNPGVNCGSYLVKRATISSHSRELLAIEALGNLVKILDKPAQNANALMDLAGNVWSDTSAAQDLYIGLNFSVFDNMGSCIDTAFVEPIECNITLGTAAACFQGTAPTIDVARTELQCFYYNLSESDLRAVQNENLSQDKPLSLLCKSNYIETPVVQSADGSTLTVPITCPNLITRTFFTLTRQSVESAATADTGYVGNHQPINRIDIYASGRLLYSYASDREAFFENAAFFNASSTVMALSTTMNLGTDQFAFNTIVHNWQISNDSNRFSGAISGKGCSSMYAVITFTPTAAAARYTLNCVHEYLNIVSISGSSGKISTSISL